MKPDLVPPENPHPVKVPIGARTTGVPRVSGNHWFCVCGKWHIKGERPHTPAEVAALIAARGGTK